MTQAQLELIRFALAVARLQLVADEGVAKYLGNFEHANELASKVCNMNLLADQIKNGSIIGTDAGRC